MYVSVAPNALKFTELQAKKVRDHTKLKKLQKSELT